MPHKSSKKKEFFNGNKTKQMGIMTVGAGTTCILCILIPLVYFSYSDASSQLNVGDVRNWKHSHSIDIFNHSWGSWKPGIYFGIQHAIWYNHNVLSQFIFRFKIK